MADYGLIDLYLDDLRGSLRWHRNPADIVAEAEDHLRSTVDHLVANGLGAPQAQRRALEGFGDPVIVARAFALNSRGRPAVPTSTSKDAGTIAVISGWAWLVYPAVWLLGGWLYDRVGPDQPGDELGSPAQLAVLAVGGGTLLVAAASMLVTWIMLSDRHGGFDWPGRVGIVLSGLGTAATLFGWFLVGWGAALAIATLLMSVELFRCGLVPRSWVLITGGGLPLAAIVWGVLRFARVGSPDQFGNYLVADITGVVVGSTILGLGLLGLGRWLANEVPVDLVRPDPSDGDAFVGNAYVPSAS